jgi:cell volume regulation protein A
VIAAGDRLHLLVTREAAGVFPSLIERWRDGPIDSAPRPDDEVWVTVPVHRARQSE